jgi:hypothetical protein
MPRFGRTIFTMKYQTARACAVASCTSLYQELEVLPDVRVAEEARDCGQIDIFDIFMKGPNPLQCDKRL